MLFNEKGMYYVKILFRNLDTSFTVVRLVEKLPSERITFSKIVFKLT